MPLRTLATPVLLATFVLTGGRSEAAVSISVAEPNFYGRIDIGRFPSPRVVYEQPVIVRRVKVWYPPIYLPVPPGHTRADWKGCRTVPTPRATWRPARPDQAVSWRCNQNKPKRPS